jgi:hypothetical protein
VTPSADQPQGLSHCDADPGCNREFRALSPYRAVFSEILANGQALTVGRRSLSRDTRNSRSNQPRATQTDREELVHCITYLRSAAGLFFGSGAEGRACPLRYVTTGRRYISRKEPGPEGWGGVGPLAALLLGHVGSAMLYRRALPLDRGASTALRI